MQVAILENVIIYIPVAEETLGGTPRLINSGLKITPPPRPSAPATHPPPNPRARTILKVLPSNIKSFLDRLTLSNSLLRPYSWATNLTPTITKNPIIIMNPANKLQSPIVHFSKPGVPLKKLIAIKNKSSPKLMSCFFQTPWLFSYLTRPLNSYSLSSFTGSSTLYGKPLSSQSSLL